MSAPASPARSTAAEPASQPLQAATMRLTVVPTPQPPLDPQPVLRLVLPGVEVPRTPHRPGPRPRREDPPAGFVPGFEPTWSVRADLPDPRLAGRRLLTLTLEALAGRRPLAQVRPLAALGVYTALTSGRRPRWCVEGTAPVLLGPVRVCEPVDGVAEVSAVARRAGRAHAVAARLEGIDGRWTCTALQIG
ncbi:Rv3235 family protein [Geodermatophilus sp. DSM 44513]|uniref:Rv3235 family protein n=1 Tax=Geodermatophilus sp. DSM 44513 TaxID=1528104 RepID=UPI001281289A|nr:Rv3235 family protein [Geodermatophilus sp. DSM 44513]WNV74739.1 Rv3235 family protein [Geodermatophilus sp. DSM 44513]